MWDADCADEDGCMCMTQSERVRPERGDNVNRAVCVKVSGG